MRRGVGVLLAAALLLGGCGDDASAGTTTTGAPSTEVAAVTSTAAEPMLEVMEVVDIEYGAGQLLDIYHPAEPGPWPTVVLVHGYEVRRQHYKGDATAMAAQGLVVFNISVMMHLFDADDLLKHLTLDTSIAQEACAIRFARATAADYGGDPDRIVLAGHSAGASTGIVAALAGDAFPGECVVAEGSSLPDAFVGYEGPYSWSTRFGPLKGGDYVSSDEMWELIDPYRHIGGNPSLVVRLVHGDWLPDKAWDPPLRRSESLQDALAEAGYDTELVVVEGANHMAFDSVIESVLDVAEG
ncbi:MAG: alpha/beta hydrolase [Acidimicrobiia bacterium]|nr:alpha/beta hydrolase [Acidimicrobiia bacterium]